MTTRVEPGLPQYRAPEIETLRDGDLLEEIGPAQAYTGNFPFGF